MSEHEAIAATESPPETSDGASAHTPAEANRPLRFIALMLGLAVCWQGWAKLIE